MRKWLALVLALSCLMGICSVGSAEQAYLIPDSNTRALTYIELWDWNMEAVNFIYNEILARHGYVFKSGGKFDNYFRSKGWYTPNANPNNQQACYPSVSSLEWSNISMCKQVINDMIEQGTTNPGGKSIRVGIPTVSNVLSTFQYCSLKAGQKLDVYSAPSYSSWRGSNGKAAVSTNGDLWSAGWENGWMMVMYGTNKGSVRVGYVQGIAGACPETRTLNFAYVDATVNTNCTLTDDPAKQYAAVVSLPAGTHVTYLTSFYNNVAWDYVETTVNGQTVRGFIPSDYLNVMSDLSPEIIADG